MFGFFGKKSGSPKPPPVPPAVPPPPPSVNASKPPPIPPRQPRKHHHEMTHDFFREGLLGNNRPQFVEMVFRPEAQHLLRKAWDMLGQAYGKDAVPSQGFEASTFKHESRLCSFIEFPQPVAVGEAALGFLVTNPGPEWKADSLAKASVRYFVLETAPNRSSVVKECLPQGFAEVCRGPAAGSPITAFSDLCFEQVLGKRRPTAEEVASRLYVLKHLVIYSQASVYGRRLYELPDVPPAAKSDLHTIMGGMFSETLKKENLWDSVSPLEEQFFNSPVQNLTQQQIVNAFWRSEAAQVLAWALGLISELPPWDTRAGKEVIGKIASGGVQEFLKSARLRDEKEIDRVREIAELWHWRSRTRQLVEEGRPFQSSEAMRKAGMNTVDDIVRITARMAAEEGTICQPIKDDFPVNGKAYGDLIQEEWADVRSVTRERHFALNWLCGYAPLNQWDKTPTNT